MCGCPQAAVPSIVSESLEMDGNAYTDYSPLNLLLLPKGSRLPQRVLRGGQGAIRQFRNPCCPEGFEGWTGCHPSVSESLELQPAAAAQRLFQGRTGCHPSVSESLELQPAAAAQRVLRGGQGAVRQFRNR